MSDNELTSITESFQTFCTNDEGKLNIKDSLSMMESIGLHKKEPLAYAFLKSLDTEENQQKNGLTIDELLDELQKFIGNKKTREGVRKIFELFTDDHNANTITLNHLKRFATEYDLKITSEEIKDMLERSSKNGNELTFD